jgi:transcription-repair coupling factor (superfamily II helicase)
MIPAVFKLRIRSLCLSRSKFIFRGFAAAPSDSFLAAVFNHRSTSQLNHLVILRDAEEAAYFHNTFENITNALDIFYFPASFKNKKNYRLLNSSHVMLAYRGAYQNSRSSK